MSSKLTLYANPLSPTSRIVMHFMEDQSIAHELKIVDLMKGEHLGPDYTKINPWQKVPCLVTEVNGKEFKLTESQAIIRYLAATQAPHTIPSNPEDRSKMDQIMSVINDVYMELGYHSYYPQVFPHHKRATDPETKSIVDWGRAKTKLIFNNFEKVHTTMMNPFLVGSKICLADYVVFSIFSLLEYQKDMNFSMFPKIQTFMKTMKEKTKSGSYQGHKDFIGMMQGMNLKLMD